MQFYSAKVLHAGNRGTQIFKEQVTPAEIVMLRHIHGVDSITDVTKTREGKVQQVAERERLASRYGAKVFASLFPGALPRLPLTLADAGLNEDGRETQAREAHDEDDDAEPAAPSEAARAIAARVAGKLAAGKGDSAALT